MALDSAAVLSGEPLTVFETASVVEPELKESEQTEKNRECWDKFIYGTLIEWGRNVSALEDEGFIPPGLEIINLACQTALAMRDQGFPPPTRIVPDGEGGISFERVVGTHSDSLNIYADRTIELLSFDDCRLSARYSL